MRLGWPDGSALLVVAVHLSTAGCTCEVEPAVPGEIEVAPESPDGPPEEPRLLTGRRAVNGGFFQVSVPEGWTARRTLRSMVLAPPPERARINVIIGRPVPFEGDAAAYAEALRPAFEQAGFAGDPGHEGMLGDVPATIVDGIAPGATARYWFVSVEGYGTSLACTGRIAAAEQVQAACDDIARTFRLTEPMGGHVLFEEDGEVTVETFHFTSPEGWEVFDPGMQDGVVVALRPTATEEGEAETHRSMGATLTARPFGEDIAGLRRQAELSAVEGGYTVELRDGTLLSRPATLYDIDQPAELGGRRARMIETVSDGRAIRLTCYGAPDDFERVTAACDTIAGSLRE